MREYPQHINMNFQVQNENDASHTWRILVGKHDHKRNAENDALK